ncbi:tetratricopeptide repeat protein [Desmonostoc muscorum LEGE 12446]|uniref:Tetratricopeptide repeat protein n=1 Tax=Desmonostoc muscorum LEGE 12446 TaxID=1828758 RepID=A0A8J7D0D0_DESMC|nr:tetratricopeptide repeat protein [Desmonostoc muscorum]MCF2145664.1 tetratricopeptide repeat protein [Desmonostoc muscorum LEGE 12446]
MNRQNTLEQNILQQPEIAKVILLEGESGSSRLEILQQWLQVGEENKAKTWLLSFNTQEDGLWSGLNEWLNQLLPDIQEKAPHLIEKHSYELAMILPGLRRQISVKNPNLTDSSIDDERVRNYPLDRAYRIIHGVINLLDSWFDYTDASPWLIACNDYEQAGFLVRRFFAELVRRRGQKLKLSLVFAAAPNTGETAIAHLNHQFLAQKISLELPPKPEVVISQAKMSQLAQKLEEQIGRDSIELEIHGPRLVSYWLQSDQPEKALIWQARLLGTYNHQGFYEDALVYCEPVATQLDHLCGKDNNMRWNMVGNLFNCYATTGNITKAYQIVQEEALLKLDAPAQLVRAYYIMAMFHTRFLPEHDHALAEDYLNRSLSILAESTADIPADDRHFMTAFDMNGLALVKHRQGFPEEAIKLCKSAIEEFKNHLSEGQHRLHRSVLDYNIAQVYAAMGELEEAVIYFTAAIAADPNYSEYYNDRGNVYQRLGYLENALNDYHQAIELSPPYYEVWMNIGHCYYLKGLPEEATKAYSVALDLEPTLTPALIGRAQAFEAWGYLEAALLDYNAALALNSQQPLLLANRATLHYELGQLPEALSDLAAAIALSPDNPDFYQNRAIVLISLGQSDAASTDLQTYLRLNPDATDRAEVEENLSSLSKG